MKIKEVIVVEGHHDAHVLKQFFDVDTIVTNGSAINKETLELIKQVNNERGVILFLDPDYPGEKIRKKIIAAVGDVKQAFINKKLAISNNHKKIGVEHASKEDLEAALKNVVTFINDQLTLDYQDYVDLGFVGNKQKRIYLCDYLNIGYANAKSLYKRLNMMGMKKMELIKIMGDYHE